MDKYTGFRAWCTVPGQHDLVSVFVGGGGCCVIPCLVQRNILLLYLRVIFIAEYTGCSYENCRDPPLAIGHSIVCGELLSHGDARLLSAAHEGAAKETV